MLRSLRDLDHRVYKLTRGSLIHPVWEQAATALYLTSAALLVGRSPNRLLAATAGAASSEIIKRAFDRRRPYDHYRNLSPRRQWPRSSSFPSSHSVAAFAAAAASGQSRYFFLASLLAAARVSGGQHYPADVIFGAMVGTVVGTAVRRAG